MPNPIKRIPVEVHGLRNRTARFRGGKATMVVGGQRSFGDTDTPAVLLTVEGVDERTNETVDIEIAISVENIDSLVALLRSREKGWGGDN